MGKNYFYVTLLCLVFTLNFYGQSRDKDVDKHLLTLIQDDILTAKDVIGYKITSQHLSKRSNVTHIYYRQSYNNIEVVRAEASLHLMQDGSVLKSSNNFVRNLHQKVTALNGSRSSISALEAINSVAVKMNYTITEGLNKVNRTSSVDENVIFYSDGGISRSEIPVKQVYFAIEQGKVQLAWELSIHEILGKNWFNFYVNASTGEIISKDNWINNCLNHTHDENENTSNIHFEKSNLNTSVSIEGGGYNVFALPLENPFFGSRTLEVDPHNLNASPYGWHDTNGVAGAEFTVTRGNNVNAYEDGDNSGYQPDGGSELLFDYTFDSNYSTGTQSEDAAITNLFYWNNIIHDVLYQYGFDEESGNFQVTNYGGLGSGSDAVNAEAQDNSGTCNANFGTPSDGFSPTMQMYTCSDRDGDFDNHVVIHEYGHGISNRLTGGSANSGCLSNNEQMGEGWSDWYGNMLTMTADDVSTDLRPVGNWLFGYAQDGAGIRDYPYTTDLSADPRTYDYIKTTSGPHALGSTWAAILWEVTWDLVDEYGFDADIYNGTGGNNMALALITEGLKLQPCSPGFVDGRDAIIAADVALYNGDNQCLLWGAFAKRGLGFSASQGSTFSRTDGTEAFDFPTASLETPEEKYCVLESGITLDGGMPFGGVYSGVGVTDDGNGGTYTFDPSVAGIGIHTITYTADGECLISETATSIIEVRGEEPIIECQDITVELDESGNATIVSQDIVTNFLPGDTYIIDQTGTFSVEDISATETEVNLSDDAVSSELSVGFDFTFYGNTYSTFYISSNGFITFDENGGSGCCEGQEIPNVSVPNNLIAFAWTDLNPSSAGDFSYTTIGTAPNRILVVNINGVPLYGTSQLQTAQVKLFEENSKIEIHSTSVSGNLMTQGIESSNGISATFVGGRNRATISMTNDFVAFIPELGIFPTNCGFETTVTLDINSFDCSNIGENTVTTTVNDTSGNSSSCSSIVTVVPNVDVEFTLNETVYCEGEFVANGLGGGLPEGGVYSGPGVTDDGNGTSFTFDSSASGEGMHSIVYTNDNSCGSDTSKTVIVEVQPAIPDLECQNITITLDENDLATIIPEDIVTNFLPGDSYTVDQTGVFSPEDISATETGVSLSDDIVSSGLPLGFDFTFFGNIYSTFYISSNGFITFNGSGDSGCCEGQTIPNTSTPNNLIAFAWVDLNPSNTGSISYATIGVAPNRVLVVDIDGVPLYGTSQLQTVQVKLFEEDSRIEIHSTSVSGNLMTQGIENSDGTLATPVDGRNKATISITNDFVSFIPNVGDYPNNCGFDTTVSLDLDTFNCDNIGDNIVKVTVTDSGGNTKDCSIIVTVISETGNCALSVSSSELADRISVFPNPAKESIDVKWSNVKMDLLEIFDVNGRLISSYKLENFNGQKSIDLSSYSSGIYLLKLMSNNQVHIEKLIKE